MSLYNHDYMPNQAMTKWPQSYYTNGHLMINNAKMSKSTGNFMTLKQAISKYSADATRFALADSGDNLEDANFMEDTANAAILKLTKEETWINDILTLYQTSPDSFRANQTYNYNDLVFENNMYIAINNMNEALSKIRYHDALANDILHFIMLKIFIV